MVTIAQAIGFFAAIAFVVAASLICGRAGFGPGAALALGAVLFVINPVLPTVLGVFFRWVPGFDPVLMILIHPICGLLAMLTLLILAVIAWPRDTAEDR